jgi:quercetin dioxygenase-like cupin family protein
MPNGLRATAGALASAGAVLVLFGNAVASERDVSLHDMNAMEWVKLGTGGLAAKTVIGDAASFIIGSLEPGAATRPHHHVFETITYGIDGELVNTVGGVAHDLAPDGASLAFSQVEHGTRNTGTTRGIFIECPPVKRPDLQPPFPRLDPSMLTTADSRPNPEGRTFFQDFRETSTAWTRAAANREAALTGDQVALRVLLVAPGTANAVNLRPEVTATEQLTYLLAGAGEVTISGKVTAITAGTLISMPASSSRILFRTTGRAPARLLDFHPLSSTPLRANW